MMTIAKRRPMNIRPDAELTGWMRISAPPATAARAVEMAKAMVFTRRIDAHQPKGLGVLRDRRDRATDEACLEEGEQRRERYQRDGRWNDHAHGEIDLAEREHSARI